MSFLIAVYVNEGIVLASDRRTTYANTEINGENIIQRIGVHLTNSTDKTFVLKKFYLFACLVPQLIIKL